MTHRAACTALVLVFLLTAAGTAAAGDGAGIRFSVRTEFDEVDAGETLFAAGIVANTGTEGQFVIVEVSLAPPEEPVLVPPLGE